MVTDGVYVVQSFPIYEKHDCILVQAVVMNRRLGVFKDFLKDYARKKRKPGHYKTQTADGCVELINC